MNEIIYLPKNLIEVLNCTDTSGRVKWRQCVIGKDLSKLMSMSKVELAHYMFSGLSLYNYKDFFLSDEYLDNLDPTIELSEDNKMCYLSANTSVLCGMVNLNPGKETSDLFNFMLKIQNFYIDFYNKFPDQSGDLHLSILKKEPGVKLLDEMKLSLSNKRDVSMEEAQYLNQTLRSLKQIIFSEKNLLSWYIFNQRLLSRSKNKTKMIFTSESFFKKEHNPCFKKYNIEYTTELKSNSVKYILEESNDNVLNDILPTYGNKIFFGKAH